MTPLRKRMTDDMVSAGLASATQHNYLLALRGLAAHYHRSPDLLGEMEVRSNLLHVRDERRVAHGTFQPIHAGIQFLYERTLDRNWALFSKKSQSAQAQAPARGAVRQRGSRHRRRGD